MKCLDCKNILTDEREVEDISHEGEFITYYEHWCPTCEEWKWEVETE